MCQLSLLFVVCIFVVYLFVLCLFVCVCVCVCVDLDLVCCGDLVLCLCVCVCVCVGSSSTRPWMDSLDPETLYVSPEQAGQPPLTLPTLEVSDVALVG